MLVRAMPELSRSKLTKLVSEGLVTVNGEAAAKSGQTLRPGDEVEFKPPEESGAHELVPADIDLDVRYEDSDLLVVNKPRGMVVHPGIGTGGDTLVHALLHRPHSLGGSGQPFRPGIVHRLDKETSGLMVVAKNDAAHAGMSALVAKRTMERRYVAWLDGSPEHSRFTIDAPLAKDPKSPLKRAVVEDGKPAVTHVQVLARVEKRTLVSCRLETGRTHQIRVHLAAFGFSVVGDRLYGQEGAPLQLHAAYLAFTHPMTSEKVSVYAEPPNDFASHANLTQSAVVEWT